MCTDALSSTEKCIADLLQDLLITDDAQNKTKNLTCYTPYLVIKGQFSSSILWHKHFLSHLHIWCVKYTFLKYTRSQGTRWQDTNLPRPQAKFSAYVNVTDGKTVVENKAWYTLQGVTFQHSPESGESVYIRIFVRDIIPCNYNAVVRVTVRVTRYSREMVFQEAVSYALTM